jgi:quinol monooxygenase YgiN
LIIESVGIVAPPENRDDLCRVLSSLLEPTRVGPGCLSCLIYHDWSDANVVYIESRWETFNDLIYHIGSERYKRLLLLMEMKIEQPSIEFLTA